jgi:hypothetical protein
MTPCRFIEEADRVIRWWIADRIADAFRWWNTRR